jgi:hypothetical protein
MSASRPKPDMRADARIDPGIGQAALPYVLAVAVFLFPFYLVLN